MPRHVVVIRRWQVALAFLAVTVAYVVGLVLLERLVHRVNHERVVSCQRTYEGVREVFRPFFRKPAVRTAKEQRDIAKFNATVDRLKERCSVQIHGGHK